MEFKPEILQLAALRQSRGISLESIAEKTKISCYYLRAIEDLDMAKLPAGVYRDNFLRQYAAAIDEDLAADLQAKMARLSRSAAEAQAKAKADASLMRSVKERLARGAAILFLLDQAVSAPAQTAVAAQSTVHQDDPRFHAIRNFFLSRKCPIVTLSAEFLAAADRFNLDWRLLPSIALLESGGGKVAPGGNPLGWGSGKAKFMNAAQAIHHVAERLAMSPIYAGKDLKAKLRIYNPANREYAARVQEVMEQLGPRLVAAR
jgi:transcriptional regulator with XRE-family HTH domain